MTQPEALRLADELIYVSKYSDSEHWNTLAETAAELRQLHEANEAFGKRQEWWNERMFVLEQQRDALLEALKKLDNFFETYRPEGHPVSDPHELVRAAIKKAEENT
jgi:hypothetical protein